MPDNGFELLRAELREFRDQFRQELTAGLATTEARLRAEIAVTRRALGAEIAEARQALGAEIAETQRALGFETTETRRYVGVLVEDLKSKLDLVIEGVRGVDERLERFRGEVREDLQKADRRFLRLEARILGRS